jgi:DNA-binding transcriptional LysR family regulator
MTSNNAEALLAAALGGMGIVLFPDWLVSEPLQRGELIPLPALDAPSLRNNRLSRRSTLMPTSAPERQGGD